MRLIPTRTIPTSRGKTLNFLVRSEESIKRKYAEENQLLLHEATNTEESCLYRTI